MTIDLESRVESRLQQMAADAPTSLDLTAVATRVRHRQRRRSAVRTAVMVGALAAVTVGALAVRRHADDGDAAISVTAPAGVPTESPLARASQALFPTSIVKPGAVALQLADGQHLAFGITAGVFYDHYGQQTTIQYDGYATGRAQPLGVDLPLIPEPELGGNDHVTFWTGLPTATTRVELRAADGTVRWQTPVDGIAAFPVADHDPDDTLVAFDANGTQLASATWSTTRLVGEGSTNGGAIEHDWTALAEPTNYGDIDVERISWLNQAQEDEYRSLADATMHSCLADGDGSGSAWTACVQATDATVDRYLTDLAEAAG